MKIEVVTQKDLKEINRWWDAWNWPRVPSSYLPDTGFIIKEDGIGVAACWVYLSSTPLAWMEWMISNPGVDKEVRGKAIDALILHITDVAAKEGLVLFTTVKDNQASYINRLVNTGFKPGDSNMKQFIKA